MKALFSILLALFCTLASAQDSTVIDRKSCLEIHVGAGFPFGSFLKKDFRDPKSGFANVGSNLHVEYQRRLPAGFGALVRLSVNSNPYDVYELAKSYKNADSSGDASYSVNSRNWYCVGATAGLSFTIPMGRFGLIQKALGGFMYAESPTVKQTVSNGVDSSTIKISSGKSSGFVWTTGTSLYFMFTRKLSGIASIEYLSFNGTFEGSQLYINDRKEPGRTDFNMDILLLNCTLGLRYHF